MGSPSPALAPAASEHRTQDLAKMLASKRASLFVFLFLLPCVFSFILPQPFRSLFESDAGPTQNTERQSDLSEQIIPVAIIAFTASLFNSFVSMLFAPKITTTVDCTYTGSNWHWGYEGVYGASCWGDHYPTCNGVKQSPIDIPAKYGGLLTRTFSQQEVTPLKMSNYKRVAFTALSNSAEHYGSDGDRVTTGIFKNNGHTAQLDAESTIGATEGILTGGQLAGEYQILQLHFHWGANDARGSEHTVDGKEYPLELHVVHRKVGVALADLFTTPKSLSVTGFFFEVDKYDTANTALAPLTNALEQIITSGTEIDFSTVNFSLVDLLKPVAPIDGAARSSRYSTYEGSLTTPGCYEVVEWNNFLTPLKVSRAQLAQFRMLDDSDSKDIVDNYRPPQPLNGRTVKFWA